ncbi:MAG: ABC transporter ATP-binding protein [Desulfovibrio sp.]|jgi:iron complex transport system ATP-binding protein|nr:ABC transporter ATP-binding protein [Desulfovibrio sp.]
MLKAEHLSFFLNGWALLEDVSFSLERGDCLFVIGPNGAGKTTLLRSLLRLHETGRYGGRVELAGRDAAALTRRELAKIASYAPQDGGAAPPFTVEEFLQLSRYPHIPPSGRLSGADREAVRRALRLTGLEGQSSALLRHLSGGERRKAYLAAALAQEAELMFLDEPAAFLDPRHEAELHRLLKQLNREQGLTVVTVTHNLNHALDAGGNVLALKKGRALFFGPGGELAYGGLAREVFDHAFSVLRHPVSGRPLLAADSL